MTDRKRGFKRFILQWNINNYSSCVQYTKGLDSPAFQLRDPLSSWNLKVKFSGTNKTQICLYRQFMCDASVEINVRLLLCLKTLNGPETWRYESRWLYFAEGSTLCVPFIWETNDKMVVTCVMLIRDKSRYSDPNVKCLYQDIKRFFNNNSGTRNTNAILIVGEQKKSIRVHKEILSAHSKTFRDFYRDKNDDEFQIEHYSPEVIVSILKFLYSGDIDLLANDRNIFELWSCASLLDFSRLIDIFCSESLFRTSEFILQDIPHKWYYKNFTETVSDCYLVDTGLVIFPLAILECRIAFQTEMNVNMTSGVTTFFVNMWLLTAESVSGSFSMEMSVCDNEDYIHIKRVELMNPDSEGIYRQILSMENEFLFGKGNVSFPRHIKFNFKFGAIHDLTDYSISN